MIKTQQQQNVELHTQDHDTGQRNVGRSKRSCLVNGFLNKKQAKRPNKRNI